MIKYDFISMGLHVVKTGSSKFHWKQIEPIVNTFFLRMRNRLITSLDQTQTVQRTKTSQNSTNLAISRSAYVILPVRFNFITLATSSEWILVNQKIGNWRNKTTTSLSRWANL